MAALISHRFATADAAAAYELLGGHREPYHRNLLDYGGGSADHARTIATRPALRRTDEVPAPAQPAPVRIAFIGADNYGGRILIPAFAASGAKLQAIASRGGLSAAHYGKKFCFREATTGVGRLCGAADVDALVVCMRRDAHADYVCSALAARMDVFVETPLALTLGELGAIERAWHAATPRGRPPLPMVGFNRRFAPQVRRMRALLDAVRMLEPPSLPDQRY